jgi:phosphoribosylaminoimidazole-succinocarboxamide synthase
VVICDWSDAMGEILLRTDIPGYPVRSGKVRDVYDLGEQLLIVATDRISAFDWVLPSGIPDKGRVLTQLTLFWLDWLGVPNHLISADVKDFPAPFQSHETDLRGRSMLVRKTLVFPVECVVRGYLSGSGWKDYRHSGAVCEVELPEGLVESAKLSEPIFTPATKADTGHDENIPFHIMQRELGGEVAAELRRRSIDIYQRASAFASGKGILIADTKFEWGRLPTGEILLIDEVLTPDSSRFWPASTYREGTAQQSFDKQFVRDWLESVTWDKNSPPPELPAEVVEKTRQKYLEALKALTGKGLS